MHDVIHSTSERCADDVADRERTQHFGVDEIHPAKTVVIRTQLRYLYGVLSEIQDFFVALCSNKKGCVEVLDLEL